MGKRITTITILVILQIVLMLAIDNKEKSYASNSQFNNFSQKGVNTKKDNFVVKDGFILIHYHSRLSNEVLKVGIVLNDKIFVNKEFLVGMINPDYRSYRYIDTQEKLSFFRTITSGSNTDKIVLTTKSLNSGEEKEEMVFSKRFLNSKESNFRLSDNFYFYFTQDRNKIMYVVFGMFANPIFLYNTELKMNDLIFFPNLSFMYPVNPEISPDKKIVSAFAKYSGDFGFRLFIFEPDYCIKLSDIADWKKFTDKLQEHKTPGTRYVWERLGQPTRASLSNWQKGQNPNDKSKELIIADLNRLICRKPEISLLLNSKVITKSQANFISNWGNDSLATKRINTLFLSIIFPDEITKFRYNTNQELLVKNHEIFEIGRGKGIRIPHKCWSPFNDKILFVGAQEKNWNANVYTVSIREDGSPMLGSLDIENWGQLLFETKMQDTIGGKHLYKHINEKCKKIINKWQYNECLPESSKYILLKGLNQVLKKRGFLSSIPMEYKKVLKKMNHTHIVTNEGMSNEEIQMLNRSLLKSLFPLCIGQMQKKVEKVIDVNDTSRNFNPDLEWTENGMVITCKNAIYVRDVKAWQEKKGKVNEKKVQKLDIPSGITDMRNGRISPDGDKLMFFGIRNKAVYLFIYNLKTNGLMEKELGRDTNMENYQGAWIYPGKMSIIKNEYEYQRFRGLEDLRK